MTKRSKGKRRKNPGGVRIVHNKLLGGWYVVRGPHQTPLNGRFDSKAAAQAYLLRKRNPDIHIDIHSHNTKGGGNVRAKNPGARFNALQLSRLRSAYSKLDRVDPLKPGYQKLAPYLDGLTQPQLKQLADARIKFLSKLAANRITRTGNPIKKTNKLTDWRRQAALKYGKNWTRKDLTEYERNKLDNLAGKHYQKENPIKGPGKFEGETYAARYAYENPDDEIGESDALGWYGRFEGKIKGRGPFCIIVREDSQGFVYGQFYDTPKQLAAAWRRIEREYEKFYDESESE